MAKLQSGELKWPTLVALPVLTAATYFGWNWVWGLLFVYWGLSSALREETYLVEPLYRGRQPVLFWLVSAIWVAFGLWYVIVDVPPRL